MRLRPPKKSTITAFVPLLFRFPTSTKFQKSQIIEPDDFSMTTLIEQLIARTWNRFAAGNKHPVNPGGLDLGFSILDGQTTNIHYGIPQTKRMEHVAILGKTGTGKSTLLRH